MAEARRRGRDGVAVVVVWFYEYNYERRFPYAPDARGARTDGWKYARHPHGDGKADRHKAGPHHVAKGPDGLRSQIDGPGRAVRAKGLRAALSRRMKGAGLEKDTTPPDEGIKKEMPGLKAR